MLLITTSIIMTACALRIGHAIYNLQLNNIYFRLVYLFQSPNRVKYSKFTIKKMYAVVCLLVYFSVVVLSDESDELLVTVISIQCCVCTRL